MPSPPPRRAWGTRYDSLVDTPPSGSPIACGPEVALHLSSATGTVDVERESRDRDATHAPAEKERSNPDHDLHSSSVVVQNSIDTSSPIQARMPHDASVFVASLPSQIPEAELQVLLSEHLSKHANIKHIKLIRDNRGSVCAFVQVESASQASNLIAACALSPFMDRYIRCEKARAFRTLLVSWRPTVSSAQSSDDLQGRAQDGVENSPLRLRRCRGTKYIQVTLGSEAISSDPAQFPNYNPPRPDDPLSGSGILFPGGLKEGDLKCLKTLLEAFGPLEFITPFEAATHLPAPPPHTSPYASEPHSGEESTFMRGGSAFASIKDGGNENSEQTRPQPPMWAVKWEHRNDAVSAITALQYVPSLFVCWSHTYGRPHHPPYSQLGPYGHSRNSSGLHTQPSHPSTCGPNDADATHPCLQAAHEGGREANAQWAVVPMASGARIQQLHTQPPTGIPKTEQQDPITFSESDFPPLSGEGSGIAVGRGRGKRGAWLGRRSFVRAGAPSPPPISTTINAARVHTEPNTPTSAVPHTPDLESVVEPSPITAGFPVTPRTPSGGYAPHADEMRKDAMYASAQGYTVPYPSVPGYIPPIAPRQGYIVQQTFPAPYATPHTFPLRHGFEEVHEKLPQGRELFIGGLDMETWDEERVRNVFGQYGTIEEMRFVKPGYHAPAHRRAFAFVKFTDYEASQKAIKEEHMRVYDDRKIKVQLRDVNPPRRWGYRGRGRFNQGLLRTDRGSPEFDQDSSMGEVDKGIEGGEPDENGHVRFASAPEMGSFKVEPADDVYLNQKTNSENTFCHLEDVNNTSSTPEAAPLDAGDHGERASSEPQTKHETGSVGSSCSDGAPDASMEVQNHSADTTLTVADVTVTQTSPPAESTHHELQSEPDSQTVTSTPPQSNPDAASVYAPSSAGSAPTNNGYYAQPPSWIPPYAMPPTSYGPYGYYPQQVAGQSTSDGSNPYPWMAALYRNVVPFVPWFNPPPGVELAPAPVRPTGYIQREPGGIFIPVYPPERLGQYMSTSGTTVDQSQVQSQPASTIGNWQNLAPHPQLYPVPFPMQQTMMMPQQASVTGQQSQHQHPQQLPLAGNGWISAPPPGTMYPSLPPSSAPPPYPAPNSYYPSQASSVSANSGRAGMYGQHDSNMHQTSMKSSNRRGTDYSHQQHRIPGGGPREGRIPHQRRGLGGSGMNGAVDHTFPVSAETQWQMKPNGALPAQLGGTSSNTSQWN